MYHTTILLLCLLPFVAITQNDKSTTDQVYGYIEEGQYEKAIFTLNAALNENPENLEYLKLRAIAYENIGEIEYAISDFSTVIAKEPSANHYWTFARLYGRNNYFTEGVELLNEALTHYPENKELISLLANTLFFTGDYAEALPWLTKAIELDPTEPLNYLGRGKCYYRLYELEAANADYKRAIQLGITDINTYVFYEKGISELHIGNYEQAKVDFKAFQELYPEEIMATYYLGIANMLKGDFQHSEDAFNECLQLIHSKPKENYDIYKYDIEEFTDLIDTYLPPNETDSIYIYALDYAFGEEDVYMQLLFLRKYLKLYPNHSYELFLYDLLVLQQALAVKRTESSDYVNKKIQAFLEKHLNNNDPEIVVLANICDKMFKIRDLSLTENDVQDVEKAFKTADMNDEDFRETLISFEEPLSSAHLQLLSIGEQEVAEKVLKLKTLITNKLDHY